MPLSSVRATTRTYGASSTPEMKHLRPLMTQSSPSRRATVASRWKFEPASGSVMAKTIFTRAVGDAGQEPLRAAPSVPCLAMIGAGDRRRHHEQQQRAAGRGQLLADDRQFGDAAAAAAVLRPAR